MVRNMSSLSKARPLTARIGWLGCAAILRWSSFFRRGVCSFQCISPMVAMRNQKSDSNRIQAHRAYSSSQTEQDRTKITRKDAIEKGIQIAVEATSLVFSLPPIEESHALNLIDRFGIPASISPDVIVAFPKMNKTKHGKKRRFVKIPRVGFSFYKTDISQVSRCLELALNAGIRHFDVATQYKTNAVIGQSLSDLQSNSARWRRNNLFIAHKVANHEQSTDKAKVIAAVKKEMEKLQITYLDLCYVHSPLTDSDRRLATYKALLDMQRTKLVRAVGVCNYGVGPLDEIIRVGLTPPAVIQLELSPFNQHRDVVRWALDHGSSISCAAWSKLSSVDGPQEGWVVLADIAKSKGVTKSQILVKWALQKGFLCVPRSGSASKIEKKAISENSFLGVNEFGLTEEEMDKLNSLDQGLKAGHLGRRDGWQDGNVKGDSWDPTDIA